jgi:hypothetical protein
VSSTLPKKSYNAEPLLLDTFCDATLESDMDWLLAVQN